MNKFRVESEPDSKYTNGVQFFLQTTKSGETSAAAHVHNTIEIIFVESGSFTVYADDEEYEIFAGDVILFRSNVMHHIFAGKCKSNSYYVLKIMPDAIRELSPANMGGVYLLNFAFKRNNAKHIWKADEASSQAEISQGLTMLKNEFSSPEKYCDIAVKLAAGIILLGLLRSGADVDEQIAAEATNRTFDCIYRAMSYVNRNYKNSLTASDVCSLVGMSYCFFSRSFKLISGKSFKQYLNHIRINHAERLLMTTDKSVSDICFECGFNDVSYFVKVYREHKQKSPGSFRSMRFG